MWTEDDLLLDALVVRLGDGSRRVDYIASIEKSISECKKVWGDYSGSGLQCDEYPFASTREGSTKGDNRFSVRLIDGTDNRKGGERLDQMYTLNRVLDGDAFYMRITD
ncbi:NucA/NucB deoxyribonuclease domain-containing protein [Streptomyces sp. NPDC001606]